MHRSLRLLPAVALGLAMGLAAPDAPGADETVSRDFPAQNFQLTLPSKEWQWLEVSASEKASQYAAHVARRIAGNDSAYVEAYVYVGPTGGLTLADFLGELRQAAQSDFQTTDETTQQPVKLSGIAGRRILVRGTAKSGGTGFYLWHLIEKSGTFHGLLVKAYNGAEKELADEIDALRRGYRLLKGAGPVDAKEEDGGAGGGGSADDKPGKGEKARVVPAEPWPPNGPKREGSTILFPSWNMKWTLPEGGPWQIDGVADNEANVKDRTILIRLVAKLPGFKPEKPVEGEPEHEVVDPVCQVLLAPWPAQAGFTPKEILRDDGLLKNVSEKQFDKVEVSRRRNEDDAPVGNYRGAAMQLVGTKGDGTRFFRMFVVHLRGIHYQWEIAIDGDKYADDVFKEPLKALMAGVHFLETAEAVRGPWTIDGVPHSVAPRGKVGEAKDVVYGGFHFKRPKDVHELDVPTGAGVQGLQVALEARSPDGKAYLYVDVSTRSAEALQKQKQSPETIVSDRKAAWETGATDPTTGKGKEPFSPGSFGPGKGVTYRFTGTFQDNIPVVEKGWVVKVKGQVFWIREQFVGADAEKAMAGVAKSIEKAIKFDK